MGFAEKGGMVTGGARGLGGAMAMRWASEGAAVVIADHDEPRANGVRDEIVAASGRAIAVKTDVSRPEEVAAMVAATLAAYGRLDIQVSNAGIGGMHPFL